MAAVGEIGHPPLIRPYGEPGQLDGRIAIYNLLKRIRPSVRDGLAELARLGRSLWRRAEISSPFDTGASNGPDEAINGCLEHLHGVAIGFRNLGHHTLQSLIHPRGLAQHLHGL